MSRSLSREVLEAAHCWEDDDQVPGRPAMTEFRRRARYHQSRWREAHGHPIGTQPIVPRAGKGRARLVGSRLPLDYARETGANFVTEGALAAARMRSATHEPHQSIDHQRVWADLLWSPAMSFNLFGDLAADPKLADDAVHTWWPDAPGWVCDVRFSHSPGWLDPAYTGNLIAFDAAFVLDVGDGSQAVVAVDVKYHERLKRETPKPLRLPRYVEVMKRAGVFERSALDAVNGTDLLVMWLEHLLMLSMLQHPTGAWSWGKYVVIHAAGNVDRAEACTRYGQLLSDEPTFCAMTVEQLLDARALPRTTAATLRDRYIPR